VSSSAPQSLLHRGVSARRQPAHPADAQEGRGLRAGRANPAPVRLTLNPPPKRVSGMTAGRVLQ